MGFEKFKKRLSLYVMFMNHYIYGGFKIFDHFLQAKFGIPWTFAFLVYRIGLIIIVELLVHSESAE